VLVLLQAESFSKGELRNRIGSVGQTAQTELDDLFPLEAGFEHIGEPLDVLLKDWFCVCNGPA
jgi:hypothetical protein